VAEATFRDLELDVHDIGAPRSERAAKTVRRPIGAHAAHQHGERHRRQRVTRPSAEGHEAVGGRLLAGHAPRVGEDRHGPLGQGNRESVAGLHTVRRDGPDRVVEVDLAPLRPEGLVGAGRGQDQELQSQRRHAVRRSQAFHELGDISVTHRPVVAPREPLPLRQELVQVALPAGWVGLVLSDVAEGLRGLDDRLDAPPEP
jgi:hypothetical protein